MFIGGSYKEFAVVGVIEFTSKLKALAFTKVSVGKASGNQQ